MRLSQMGLGSTRLSNINEQFPAQDILVQSGQLIQYGAGLYAYNNIPLQAKANVEKVIREELDKVGCIEIYLPTLQPATLWEESGRLEKYISDGTMLVTGEGELCLAPTAEEAVVSFARTKLKSYKDMPVIFYQIGEKFRNEIRTRGYLLRGKTFPMMDAYSFNKNEEELVESYNIIKGAYLNIFKRLGLNVIPVAADSGAIGGKKSEEFMFLAEIGEDTILYDEDTGHAVNTEVMEREDAAEYLRKEYGIEDTSKLQPRKSVELGHIFQLGKKYSESMNNATFIDVDSKEKTYYMGCYGIGVSRTLANIYENNIIVDDKGRVQGISLPTSIAPYAIQLIYKNDNEQKHKEAEKLYESLISNGINVLIDDRQDESIGSKIKEAKVLGTPYIAVFGDKTGENEIEVENIKTGNKIITTQDTLLNALVKFESDRFVEYGVKLEDYIG